MASLISVILAFSVSAADRPLLVFFGGYKSTRAQMEEWSRAVQKVHPQFEVIAVEYPSSSANGDRAVAAAQATLKRLSELINGKPGRDVVIAGHSSGAALSNALARKVINPHNVRLVALDGYSPDQALQRKFQTTCWSAQNGAAKSRNYNTSKANCGVHFRVFNSPQKECTSAWCLHFAVVNAGARFASNWAAEGYKNLIPNLAWLAPVPGSQIEPQPLLDGSPLSR